MGHGPSRSISTSSIMPCGSPPATAYSGNWHWPDNRWQASMPLSWLTLRTSAFTSPSTRCPTNCRSLLGFRKTGKMHRTIRPRCGAFCRFSSMPTASSSNSAPASSARQAPCISSGAASILRSHAFPAGTRRAIPAACEAYSHEESSAGFWPGSGAIDYPAFYSYAYPEPPGFRTTRVRRDAAFFSEALGEFILPYDAVRTAAEPDQALLECLQSTYEAAANAANWDRDALECAPGRPGVVRQV